MEPLQVSLREQLLSNTYAREDFLGGGGWGYDHDNRGIKSKKKNRQMAYIQQSHCEYISKRNSIGVLERYLFFYVHCSTYHNSQKVEST